MDLTITFDEVTTLVGANLPSLEPRPTFERIRTLRRHFERALQRLPCPQSTLHGWKGLVMARELYTLLTGLHNPFRVPVDPGAVAIYTRPVVTGQPVDLSPLSRLNKLLSTHSLLDRNTTSFPYKTSNVHASPCWMRASTTHSKYQLTPRLGDGMPE